MNETTREDQKSRLDQFAAAPLETRSEIVPVAMAPTQQIVGAQKVASYRDERRVKALLAEKAAAAGEDWYYRFPVRNKKKGTVDYIEGPSVKLANVLWRTYGNCEVDCRAQDLGSAIMFYARFVDLENGAAYTRPFQQRKGAAKLGSDAGRLDEIDFSIGASKATRNVVVNALPELAEFAFQEAKGALVDKIGGNLEHWRKITVERLETLTALPRVEAVVGRPAKDWLAPDIAKVIAMGKAVAEGMATVDETFPPLQQAKADISKNLDRFANAMVEDDTGPADAGPAAAPASSTAPPPKSGGAAASDDDSPLTPTGIKAAQEDMIFRLLRMAQDASLTPQERRENLENLSIGLHDMLPEHGGFVDTALNTAAKVATGKMPPLAALKYLTGLVTP